jgi:hypothetical protein
MYTVHILYQVLKDCTHTVQCTMAYVVIVLLRFSKPILIFKQALGISKRTIFLRVYTRLNLALFWWVHIQYPIRLQIS